MLYFAGMSASSPQVTEVIRRTDAKKWRAAAREAIAAQGLLIAKETSPKKSFKEHERFFIQKCTYPDGQEVMVKVSAPTIVDRITVKKEAYWYRRMHELVSEARQNNTVVPIQFPEVVRLFTYKDQAGLITRYVYDDWAGFKNLSHAEREEIILKIIEGMQSLPLPTEEMNKPAEERLLPIITASAYPVRAKKYLGELVVSGHIDEACKQAIIALLEKNVSTIAHFPLKLDHGDFHSGNFRNSRDPQSGEHIITLFDLERIRITNMFGMVAAAANFFDLAAFANIHPDRERYPGVLTDVPLFNTLFSAQHMIQKLEETFVINNKRQRDAKLVYRLMRIDDCAVRLADCVYESKQIGIALNKVEVDVYKKILLQQVALVTGYGM